MDVKNPMYVNLTTAAKITGLTASYLGYAMRNNLIDIGTVVTEKGKTKRKYIINLEKLKAL